MKHNSLSSAVIASIIALGTSMNAFAGVSLSLVGVGNLTKETDSPETGLDTFKAKLGTGFGGLLDFGIAPMTDIEIGVLNNQIKYDDTTVATGLISTVALKNLEFPVLLKFRFPGVHFGVGASYFTAMGDATVTNNVTGAVLTVTYAQAGIKKSGMNALAAAGFDLPLGPSTSFMVEGRYALNFTNQADPATVTAYKVHFNSIEFLAGLTFNLGK